MTGRARVAAALAILCTRAGAEPWVAGEERGTHAVVVGARAKDIQAADFRTMRSCRLKAAAQAGGEHGCSA